MWEGRRLGKAGINLWFGVFGESGGGGLAPYREENSCELKRPKGIMVNILLLNIVK